MWCRVELSTPPRKILEVLAEEGHSRLPVYQDDVDHIVGILHVRDLVPLMQEPELIVLHDLVRPAAFVPWVKPIGDLLREMQRQKIHMSVGGRRVRRLHGHRHTRGHSARESSATSATRFDEEVKLIERQADGSWLVDAMLPAGGVRARVRAQAARWRI